MDRLVSLEPSNVVPIRIEPGRPCTGTITLRNVMYTMPVAFQLQAKEKTRYTIIPHSGIIPPLRTVAVEISYLLPPDSELPKRYPGCDDKFELNSVVAPGAAGKDFPAKSDAVPSEWFTNRKKQVYSDTGIRVVFVGSVVLARLVAKGRMEEVREALEKSDPAWKPADAVDSGGRSLIQLAISQGRPDLVQLLLEFNAEIEADELSELSPLEAAVAAGEGLIVELLLARNACPDRSAATVRGPIHLAARNGDAAVLGLLLAKGANANAAAKDGNTALHLAVGERRRDCARVLLENGARADVQNLRDGDTPLHIAAALGDEAMVKMLIKNGCNKYVRNHAGRTAYDLAAENGHGRLFDALKLGDRLCSAARKGDVRAIERLLASGAAIDGRDQNGWTALHRAALKGRMEAARALIERGIDIDARDGEGYTALHCAVESGASDVAELLVKKGADVGAATSKGATALQMAEAMEYKGIARLLAQSINGGEMGKKKGDGRTRLRRRSFDRSTPLAVV